MSTPAASPVVVDLDDLMDAFESVSGSGEFSIRAYVCRSTGKIELVGGDLDIGEEDEEDRSEELQDDTCYAPVPDRRELDLGNDLVFRFVGAHAPEDEDDVYGMFRRAGAYGRFRDLLGRRGLIDQWHQFRDAETAAALTEWAKGEGFRVAPSKRAPVVAPPPLAKLGPPWRAMLLGPGDAAVLLNVADGVFDHPVRPPLAEAVLADRSNLVAVALEGDRVVGMATGIAYVHPDKPLQLFVNEVGVAPTHRKRGIGKRLVELLLNRGTELGCESAWVATEEENIPARRLFASVQGREDRARAVVFRLPIGASPPEAPRVPRGRDRRGRSR